MTPTNKINFYGIEFKQAFIRSYYQSRFENFLKDNEKDIIHTNTMILYVPSLVQKIQYDCTRCNKPFGCCNGSTYPLSMAYKFFLNGLLPDLLKYAKMHNWNLTNIEDDLVLGAFEPNLTIKAIFDKFTQRYRCVFYRKIDHERKGCILQYYANAIGVPQHRYEPASCTLFPLDLVSIKLDFFLYAQIYGKQNETLLDISRWTDINKYTCFKPSDKPLYENMQEHISEIFGEEKYKIIEERLRPHVK